MATPYVTDSWSSLTGLAAVAYKSPSFLSEVANQVWRDGLTSPIGVSTGSSIGEFVISQSQLTEILLDEYEKAGDFANSVDLGSESVQQIAARLHKLLISAYNEISTYSIQLSEVIDYAWGSELLTLDPEKIKSRVLSLAKDSVVYNQLATALPTNKLDKLPPDAVIVLEDNLGLGRDFRNLDMAISYLTPDQYFSNVGYPGMGVDSLNVPISLFKSIEQGYVGYPTTLPLDEVLNSGFSASITRDEISAASGVVYGSGTADMIKGLSPLSNMSAADQAMYDVDLTELILAKNGYTIYNPVTDSNGNFASLGRSTDFSAENSDPDQGLPFTQRTRTVG